MPIVMVHQGTTVTQESYEEAVRRLTAGKGLSSLSDWPVQGILSHAAFATDDGFRVVDVWESEEAFGRFGEIIGPILQEVGVTDPPRVYTAHTYVGF